MANFTTRYLHSVGCDSSVGIATRYGLEGPEIESQWWPDFPHPSRPAWGPPSLLYSGYRDFFPGVKWPGRGVEHPPLSSAEVKEIVELYLYSPSESSQDVIGRPLPLPFSTYVLKQQIVITVLLRSGFELRSMSYLECEKVALRSWDIVVGTETRLRDEQTVDRIPAGTTNVLFCKTPKKKGSEVHPVCYSMATGVVSRKQSVHPVPSLTMSGAIPLLPLYVFMAWTGKILFFFYF